MIDLIHHDVEQGTAEWLHIKAGKFSGTDAGTFLVKGENEHEIGKGLKGTIFRKASECVTGPKLDGYQSKSMKRGHDLEPLARDRYELTNFVDVKQIGFIQRGSFYGYSPDGLVGTDGGIEIKCLEGPAWVEWKDSGMTVTDIPKDYFCQMQWGLYISGRKWMDYVVFNPDFSPLDYTQTRVNRDAATIEIFEQKSRVIETEITRLLNKIALKEVA